MKHFREILVGILSWIPLLAILGFLVVGLIFLIRTGSSCNCTVNWGNQTMSVEDALERMGEGLTMDQTDEIRTLINQSCED
jgi:hypothetical protein